MKNTPVIRLMCVDDNELLAAAIEKRIGLEPYLQWAGWVSETDDLLDRLADARPDVILLDIDMPGRSAFELIGDLAQVAPQIRVIIFSGHVRGEYIDRAIEAGAWGYVSKSDGIDEVLGAVTRVGSGEFALSPEVQIEQQRKMRQPI